MTNDEVPRCPFRNSYAVPQPKTNTTRKLVPATSVALALHVVLVQNSVRRRFLVRGIADRRPRLARHSVRFLDVRCGRGHDDKRSCVALPIHRGASRVLRF